METETKCCGNCGNYQRQPDFNGVFTDHCVRYMEEIATDYVCDVWVAPSVPPNYRKAEE